MKTMNSEPSEEDIAHYHRRFASRANDRAWTLSEKSTLTDEDEVELLETSHAAAYHWRQIGTENQMAHANLLLGRVHSLLGNGRAALKYAQAAFEFMSNRPSEKWELAFAHAVLANAAHTVGDSGIHKKHFTEAKVLADRLEGEERKLFLATFNLIPEPS
jgi:hypothetical protein